MKQNKSEQNNVLQFPLWIKQNLFKQNYVLKWRLWTKQNQFEQNYCIKDVGCGLNRISLNRIMY